MKTCGQPTSSDHPTNQATQTNTLFSHITSHHHLITSLEQQHYLTMATTAALQSLTCSSQVSHRHSSRPGIVCRVMPQRSCSSFNGLQMNLTQLRPRSHRSIQRSAGRIVMMATPKIQFIQGIDELTIPKVNLTRSRDGTNGVAVFNFEQPSVFDSSKVVGEITGLYMIDEEGVLSSNNVNAKFRNGKPEAVEAKYIMRTPRDWDRFMRFMERYSNANGLQFVKS